MRLEAAIERLYEVFSVYRVRSVSGCEHCMSCEELEALVAVPLRALAPEVLEPFASDAMTTVGSLKDFKHFLPRILELDLLDDWLLERKLEYALWRVWPEVERVAVETYFLETVFVQLEADVPLPLERFNVLLARFTHAQPRLEALLQSSALAPRWYAQLVCDLGQHFASLGNEQQVLLDWLLTTRRTEALERAFFEEADARTASMFSTAVLVLDWF